MRCSVTGSKPKMRNVWRARAKVPSGHGAHCGMSCSMNQKSSSRAAPVQPRSLVTVPVHSIGLTQVVFMVQVWVSLGTSNSTSSRLAHSPSENTR